LPETKTTECKFGGEREKLERYTNNVINSIALLVEALQ